MAVDGHRPRASRYARALSLEDIRLYAALREHAHEVVDAARETVAHSVELKWVFDDGRDSAGLVSTTAPETSPDLPPPTDGTTS